MSWNLGARQRGESEEIGRSRWEGSVESKSEMSLRSVFCRWLRECVLFDAGVQVLVMTALVISTMWMVKTASVLPDEKPLPGAAPEIIAKSDELNRQALQRRMTMLAGRP